MFVVYHQGAFAFQVPYKLRYAQLRRDDQVQMHMVFAYCTVHYLYFFVLTQLLYDLLRLHEMDVAVAVLRPYIRIAFVLVLQFVVGFDSARAAGEVTHCVAELHWLRRASLSPTCLSRQNEQA
jgi:hypothetical protein